VSHCHDSAVVMARSRRAWHVPRRQSGHGLAVCRTLSVCTRQSRQVVILSLAPIALGHALSISVVIAALMLLGVVVDHRMVRLAAGVLLIAWAIYHWRYGHRHRVRVGMRTGFAGLTLWSFLMATAHGAGLMLAPALMPRQMIHTPRGHAGYGTPSWARLTSGISLAAVGVHTLADAACHRRGCRHRL